MGLYLGLEIARETHYTNALDNKLTLSSRLQELTNCQANCNSDSYSYTNLPNKAPAAWATQICGRMFDCPQNDPDFLDVVQRLRSEKLESFDQGLVQSTNMLGSAVSLATEFKKRKNERQTTSAVELQKVQVQFCDEVEEVTYLVLAIRQQRINEMQRARCHTCMRAVRAASLPKEEFDFKQQVCGDAPAKGVDKIPAAMEDVPLLKDPTIAVLTQGYDTIENTLLAHQIEEQLPKPKRTNFRRRLLMENEKPSEIAMKAVDALKRAVRKPKVVDPNRGLRKNGKKCAEEGSFESYAECRYSMIETSIVECDGVQYRPRDYLKKMDKVVEENYQEKWTGSKKWCEAKEKDLEAEVDKLLEALLKITGTEALGEDANLASKIKVYNDLHSKVFIPMPISGIGGLRTQFQTPLNGEALKEYGAPLYAGSAEASLCVEAQYCTPNDAMAIKGLKLAAAPKTEGAKTTTI